MSNQRSEIGKVNYRALTIPEIKTIIYNTLKNSLEKTLGPNKPLTVHAFRFSWALKLEALTGTPLPPEIDKWFSAVAPDFTDEELESLQNNIQKLKEKRQELQPVIDIATKIDNYLARAEVEFVDMGVVDDKRTPDILRKEHNLPIMQVRREGVQIVEAPIENTSTLVSNTPATPLLPSQQIIQSASDYSPADGLEAERNELKLNVQMDNNSTGNQG